MKRRILSLGVAFAMIVGMFPTMALAATEGTWTDEGNYDTSWYTAGTTQFDIVDAADLAGVAYLTTLAAPTVDFSGVTLNLTQTVDLAAHQWVPIGSTTHPFRGTFDGGENRVENLTIQSEGTDPMGLFGHGENNTICNLTVTGSLEQVDTGARKTGGIVASQVGGSIYNCTSYVDVLSAYSNAGGIVGKGEKLTIHDCTNYGNLTTPGYAGYVGGIVGEITNSSKLYNCANYGDILLKGRSEMIGGIAGYATVELCNSFNAGDITGELVTSHQNIGGIVGMKSSGYDENNYNCGQVAGTAEAVGSVAGFNATSAPLDSSHWLVGTADRGVGDSNGTEDNTQSFGATDADKLALSESLNLFVAESGKTEWRFWGITDENDGYPVFAEHWSQCAMEPPLDGNTYTITTAPQLAWVAKTVNGGNSLLGKTILVAANINLSAMAWEPIGTEANPFQGIFQGGGCTINEMRTDTDADNQGLFGVVGSDGLVNHVFVEGSVDGGANVGGIAGKNLGTITNCAGKAAVIGTNCGGLVGNNQGAVKNSYTTATLAVGTGTVAINYYDETTKASTSLETLNTWAKAEGCLLWTTINETMTFCTHWDGVQVEPQNVGGVYQISNGEELAWLTTHLDADGVLTKDIDLAKYQWTPIGSEEAPFKGTLNGQGYIIENLLIDNGGASYQALFGVTGGTSQDKAEVRNLTVKGKVLGASYVAGVVGQANAYSLLENCTNYASVTGIGNMARVGGVAGVLSGGMADCVNYGTVATDVLNARAGGVVASMDSSYESLTNCTNYGVVNNPKGYSGGVLGYYEVSENSTSVFVSGCSNYGEVIGKYAAGVASYVPTTRPVFDSINHGKITGSLYAGGIVATIWSKCDDAAQVYNCYNCGEVNGDQFAGGIAGISYNTINIQNVYNVGAVTGNPVGGILGNKDAAEDNVNLENSYWLAADGTQATQGVGGGNWTDAQPQELTGEFTAANMLLEMNDFVGKNPAYRPWMMGGTDYPYPIFASYWSSEATEPATNSEGVYQITSGAELAWIGENIETTKEADMELTQDISLAGHIWAPIGTKVLKYAGTFQGNGHTITEMNVFSGNDGSGLFGYLGVGGLIENLVVEGTVVSSGAYVGGIVGTLYGTIRNCGSNVDVTSTQYFVGGVVGLCNSDSGTCGQIENCYSQGSVTGSHQVGGIVGWEISANSRVNNCYSVGQVTRTYTDTAQPNYNYVGGISGGGSGTHTNVFSLAGTADQVVGHLSTTANASGTFFTEDEVEEVVLNTLNTEVAANLLTYRPWAVEETYPVLTTFGKDTFDLFLPVDGDWDKAEYNTDSFYLGSNLTLTAPVTVANGQTLKLDLNGFTLSGTGTLITVESGGNLVLSGAGSIAADGISLASGTCITVDGELSGSIGVQFVDATGPVAVAAQGALTQNTLDALVSKSDGYSLTLIDGEIHPLTVMAVTVVEVNGDEGVATADKTSAAEGETVTLSVDAPYSAITVVDESDAPVALTNLTFTMPATAVTVTVTFKQTPSFSDVPIATSYTYGDGDVTLSCTVTDGAGDVTYTSDDSEVLSIEGTTATIQGAGNATITLTIAENDNFKSATHEVDITVEKADDAISFAGAATSFDYGETVSFAPTATSGEAVTLTYKAQADTDYSADVPQDGGSYTVKGTVADSDNYNGANATHEFTIDAVDSQTDITETVADETYTYGDIITFEVTVAPDTSELSLQAVDQIVLQVGSTVLATANDIPVAGGTVKIDYDTSEKGLDIGDNQVTASYGGSVSLNGSDSDSVTITLEQAALSGTVADGVSKDYDGAKDFANVALDLSGFKDTTDAVSATATGTSATADVAASSDFSATSVSVLTGEDAKWYTLDAADVGGTVAIEALDVSETLAADFAINVVEGADTFTDPVFSGVEDETVPGDFAYTGYADHAAVEEALAALDAGATLDVPFTFTASGNYKGDKTGNLSFTVIAVTFDTTDVLTVAETPTYGDTLADIMTYDLSKVSATVDGQSIVTTAEDYILLVDGETFDGATLLAHGENYTYQVILDDGTNYRNVLALEGTFAVAKRVVEYTWDETQFDFTGAVPTLTATISNVVGEDDVTVTATTTETQVGENYAADSILSDTTNYTLPQDDQGITFSIVAAQVTGSVAVTMENDVESNSTIDKGDTLLATVTETPVGGTVAYQWYLNQVAITDAVNSTYVVAAPGGEISCVASFSGNTKGTLTSNAVEISTEVLAGTITITREGDVLTTSLPTNENITSADYTIAWYRDSVAIEGATGTTYTLTDDDLNTDISVIISAAGEMYTATLTSADFAVPPVAPDAPQLSAKTGDSLVTLTWKAPFDGGSDLTGYTLAVTYLEGEVETPVTGSPFAIDVEETSYEVTELTNGTIYTFLLTASNEAGDTDSDAVTAKPYKRSTAGALGGFTGSGGGMAKEESIVEILVSEDGAVTAKLTPETTTTAGVATVTLDEDTLNDAITKAEKAADGDVAMEISLETGATADEVSLALSVDGANAIAESDMAILTISSNLGKLEIPAAALAEMTSQAEDEELVITISHVDPETDLNANQQKVVGDGLVVDLLVTLGDTVISSFGKYEITVSLPYVLRDGEQAEYIVVWYIDDQGNIVPLETTYHEEAQLATFVTDHFSVYAIVHDSNNFQDVDGEDYFYSAVLWAVHQGITDGTSETTFSPLMGCSRAQAVTFLWKANGSPVAEGENPFVDVAAGAWYYDAVLWAVSEGITQGTSDTTFSPDTDCDRGQIVTLLYRAAGSPVVEGECTFADVDANDYCYNAVRWAVAEGITKGTSETTFSPAQLCDRGQIVTFLFHSAG